MSCEMADENKKERKFQCDSCEYAASVTYLLDQHVKSVHDQIKDQKCEACRKEFSHVANLNVHIKSVHLCCETPATKGV